MPMKPNHSFKAAILSLMLVVPEGAFAFGGDPASLQMLSQIYASIKEQVMTLKEQLDEAKVISDEVYEARDYLNAVRHEYEFMRDFDPEQELNSLIGMADGMTNLNDLNGTNWQQKWGLISGEINKRFRESDAPLEVRELNKETSLDDYSKVEQTDYLQKFYQEQALNKDMATSKDYQRQTASATSMMASVMLDKRKEDLERQARKRKALMNGLEWDYQFSKFLGGE